MRSMMQTIGRPLAARMAAFLLAGSLMAGCSGNASDVLPPSFGPQNGAPDTHQRIRTFVRMRIPRRGKHERVAHPATISPLTQSVSIAVNSAAAKIFNTTPASPGCTANPSGITCTFAIYARAGTDTFTVTTYDGANGTGIALDRGVVTVPINKGKANSVAVTLGPVVTTTADSGMGSLRYAVGAANAGDTIMFLLPAGSTIALLTPITITGNVAMAGPGAASVSISGGGTHQLFLVAGTATISGLTLTQGKAAVASQPGGAIYNLGTLTLANDVIGNSTSVVALRRLAHASHSFATIANHLHPHCSVTINEGGALYNNGTAVISGTTFNGNVIASNLSSCPNIEAQGGAIYNDQFGSLTSTGDTYSNNSAAVGGAVYNAGLGLVSFTGDAFTGNFGCNVNSGCPTTGCSATSCTSFAIGQGAAMYDHGLGVTVVNSTFTNNVAGGPTPFSQGQGGAIYLDASSQLPTIIGTTFTGNVAGGGSSSCSTGEGGAIVATNSIELDNDTFKNNSATGDAQGAGGAVVAHVNITGTGDTFTGNTAEGAGGSCTANGEGLGGAVFAAGVVTFNSSTFAGNTGTGNAEGAGGAIATGNVLTVNASAFTSNYGIATGAGTAANSEAVGGALYGGTIVKANGSTFTSNAAVLNGPVPQEVVGGAIAAQGGVVSSNDTYTSNAVLESTGNKTAGGGAVAVLSGTWISSGDTFTSNSATSPGPASGGGGIVITGGCILSNSTFTSNTATGGQGAGGALGVGGTCHITHINVSGNSASATGPGAIGAGGGLFDSGGATITSSTFTGNAATNLGGGIASAASAETLESSVVSNNAVTDAAEPSSGGGGIADLSGELLENVTVANNGVTVSGAGPAGGGGIHDGGGLFMLSSTVSGNRVAGSAPNSGGGGILTESGILSLNSTIGNNASSVDGGGLEIVGSTGANFGNVTIFKNTATGNG
ncbi:MAG: hypothetical protein JOY98_05045, partial [Candidatus Eremiobacteraeota bacterium]|nr:hypothetical protein [Candidatus Eremiobacteraeota bacterium]